MRITARDVLAVERDCYGFDGDPDISVCSTCGSFVYADNDPHTIAECMGTMREEIQDLWNCVRALQRGADD